tara:strand:- start:521 stop:1231 length:711 start_codon:yes stop_codon:yes gene_type:complete
MPKMPLEDLSPTALSFLRRHNLLRAAIQSEVIENAVGSIEFTPKESQEIWDSYLERNNIDNSESLNNHLSSVGLDQNSLHWQLELPVRIQKYCKETFNHKSEARFLAKKEQLDKIVYSLLRVDDGFLARELYLRIAGGEANFADLSAEFSQGPESKTKGIVGPVPMNQAHPMLFEKLRTSQTGELLEPFNIDKWWIVARLERFEPASFSDSTADAMSKELFEEWVEQEVAAKLAVL